MESTALVKVYEPPSPPCEEARLAMLDRYALMDTPPEDAYERVVDLTAEMFDVPIAIVTLLGRRRQWFKSRRGVDAPESERRFAFCAETILSETGLVVPSTLDDPRFLNNPFVTGSPFIRFYAGAPLMAPGGLALGALAIADTQMRRDFGERQHHMLRLMAKVVVDETELRLSQTRLNVEKSKLEFALDNAGMGLWEWDLANDHFELPPTLVTLFRRDGVRLPEGEEATLRGLMSIIEYQDRGRVRVAFEGLRDRGEPVDIVFRLACPQTPRWAEVHAGVDPRSETLVVGSVRDITEQEQMRTKMYQLERLRSVSTLGAGVAHEINNPLSVISTNLYLLEKWAGQADDLLSERDREYISALIRQSRRGTERVGAIVNDLLKLSRSNEAHNVAVDLEDILESVVRLVRTEMPDGCEFEVDIDTLPRVRGRTSLLGQVFINLLLNAVDAVEESGPREQGHRIELHARPLASGGVEVIVEDTGVGISEESLPRVFDPFYTTKPPGKGTGLGLAITRSILESFGGDVDVSSRMGRGASVRVYVPEYTSPIRAGGARPRTQL